MFWGDELLPDLRGVLLNKATGNINQLLRITIRVRDLQLCPVPHQLQKTSKEPNIRTGERIDRLPVITNSDNLCFRDLRKLFGKSKPLAGNILELVDNDVSVRQLQMLPFNFLQTEIRVIDHVRKVDLIILLQFLLIIMVHLLGDIQKQKRSRIVRFLPENLKSAYIISSRFILLDEFHHEQDQLIDIPIFTCLNDLFIYLS